MLAMPVVISMLRGVNVGGHNKIKMDALRELCASLKLRDPQTYVQSGNVVFRSDDRDLVRWPAASSRPSNASSASAPLSSCARRPNCET